MRTVESLTSGTRTVARNELVSAVRERMRNEHVHGLAVVDDHDRLVGIVTASDLLADLAADADLSACMSTEVLTASPHTSVVDAARTMRDHGFHHLVVTGHAHAVVGVLSSFDLLDAVIGERSDIGSAVPAGGPRAKAGDIVVVRGKAIDQHQRRGLITEVRGPDGGPPFVVRWLDDPHGEPHDVLFFPGSDADIEAPEPSEQAAPSEASEAGP